MNLCPGEIDGARVVRWIELDPSRHQKTDAIRLNADGREVIGHLVDSACNNHQRFVRAQHCAELVLPNYEQDKWVAAAGYQSCDWDSLVQFWYLYNRQIAVLIWNIPDSELSTPCTITPYDTCTLGFLVIDYLDHMNHHLQKLAEQIGTRT